MPITLLLMEAKHKGMNKYISKTKRIVRRFLIRWQFERFARRLRSDYGSPFIIIGMHRSGTSLVTRLLRGAGGYFGSGLVAPNSETVVFAAFNDSILNCFNASWAKIPPSFQSTNLPSSTKVMWRILSNQHLLWSGFFETFGEAGIELEGKDHPHNEYKVIHRSSIQPMFNKKRLLSRNSPPFLGLERPTHNPDATTVAETVSESSHYSCHS